MLIVAFAELVSAVVVVPASITLGSVTFDGVVVTSTIYWIYHLPLVVSRVSIRILLKLAGSGPEHAVGLFVFVLYVARFAKKLLVLLAAAPSKRHLLIPFGSILL